MGKKVDLDAARDSSTFANKTGNTHSFYTPPTIPKSLRKAANSGGNQANEKTSEAENSSMDAGSQTMQNGSSAKKPNKLTKKVAEKGLQAAGVPKGVAKKVAQDDRTYELADKVQAIIKFPMKIKIIFIAGIIAIPLILITFFVVFFLSNITGGGAIGLGGYPFYDGAATQVSVNGDLMDIEEYVARVIPGEVGEFDGETLKAFAISIRTYVIANASKVGNGNNAYYNVTETDDHFQVYSPTTTDEYRNIANETRGLIITVDGKISPGNYDASCIYTADQAKEKDPDGTYDDSNYYIKYGEWTIGGTHFQEVSKSNISGIGSLEYYAASAEAGNPCDGNHGGGMSQNGAYYLQKIENYTWEQIIDYYYENKAEIASIYASYALGEYGGNYPIDPDNEMYSNLQFLIDKSLSTFLSENGTSVEEFNNNISSAVELAGVGTRNGTIAAGVTLIGSLAERGVKLNYQWGGKYENIGVNPNWGTTADMGWLCGPSSYGAHYDSSICYTNYKWNSFDCSGFVTWAVINGMQKNVSQQSIFASDRISLKPSQAVCQPGGVLISSGHIVLVVGLDDDNKRYIVAESTGSRIAAGTGGVKLSYYNYGDSNYQCSNLNDIYGD